MNKSIAILDDHSLIIEAIEKIINENNDWIFAGGFTTFKELYNFLNNEHEPAFLLLDIHLRNEDGIEICSKIKKEFPSVKIIMLTSLSEPAIVRNAIKNGAEGFMLKNMQRNDLWDCIDRIEAGDIYLQKDIEKLMLQSGMGVKVKEQGYVPKISRREKEVLELIMKEMTTQEIAAALFISVNTVETHRAGLLTKLGARNIAGLVKLAIEKGIV